MPMTSCKALCFDLDDTLLDARLFPASIERTCRRLAATQPGLDAAQLVAANGEVWRAYWPEVEEKWTLGVLDGAAVGLEAWRRTLRACGWNDESLAQLARQTHLQFGREAHRLFEDVQGLFDGLRGAGIPLALVTNGAADTQRDKLRVLGIEQWFDAVVISGEVGIAKPDAGIFSIAVDRLGVEPEGVWHVGDNLVTDVAGARAAGIFAVWLNRRGLPLPAGVLRPDLEIRSLLELAGLVAMEDGV